MKAFLLSISISFSCFLPIQAQVDTLYWVGGLGDWSDLSNWATESGGSVPPDSIPGPQDDVVFDANSFSSPAQSVFVDVPQAYCRNMTWEDATNYPIFTLNNNMQVFGSFRLNPAMTFWTEHPGIIPILEFVGENPGNVIDMAGNRIGGGASGVSMIVKITGGGTFDLLDSLVIGTSLYGANQFVHTNGIFRTNGHKLTSTKVFFNPDSVSNAEAFLSTSFIQCIDAEFLKLPNGLHADSATLEVMRLEVDSSLAIGSLTMTNYDNTQFSTITSASVADTIITEELTVTGNGGTTLGRHVVLDSFAIGENIPSLRFDYLDLRGPVAFPNTPSSPLILGAYPSPTPHVLYRDGDSICLGAVNPGAVTANGSSVWTFNPTCTDLGGNTGNLVFGNCSLPASAEAENTLATYSMFPTVLRSGETFQIQPAHGLRGTWTIHDLHGRILSPVFPLRSESMQLPELPAGMYLFRASTPHGGFSQKLIVTE